MRYILVLAILFLSQTALAQQQQQPDLASLQRAVQVLEVQRNNALNAETNARMEIIRLHEEVERLKAEAKKDKKE